MEWATIWTSAISSGFFSGLVFLWLNHRLTNERNDLEREHQIKIEAMRTELNRVASNQQFQFTKLHEQRADAILELHERMMSVKGFLYQASGAIPGSTDHISYLEKAFENWDSLDKIFVRNLVYFKPSLCEELNDFISNGRWLIAHQTGYKHRPDEFHDEAEERLWKERDKRWAGLMNDSHTITTKITNEFRLLLGMTPEELGIDNPPIKTTSLTNPRK